MMLRRWLMMLLFGLESIMLSFGIHAGNIVQYERLTFQNGLEFTLGHHYESATHLLNKQLVLRVKLAYHPQSAPAPARSLKVHLRGGLHFERTLAIPAGETRQQFWYLPITTAYTYLQMKVEAIDLASGEQHMASWSEPLLTNPDKCRIARIGSPAPHLPDTEASEEWVDAGTLNDDEVPDIWHGLRQYQVILARAATLNQAPWRETVQNWVLMGGWLLLQPDNTNRPLDSLFPHLALKTALLPTLSGIPMRQHWQVGMGHIVLAPSITQYEQQFQTLMGNPPIVLHPPYTPSDITAALDKLLPQQTPSHPILFSILLLFSLLVGPVAWLWLVHRQGRPFLYLGFVLTVSIIVSASIFIINLLIEGFHLKTDMNSLQILDLPQQTQLWAQEIAIFRPTRLEGQRLELAPESQISLAKNPNQDVTSTLSPAWEGDRFFVENLLPVRQRVLIGQQGIKPLVQRLIFQRAGQKLAIENHLGVTLHQFWAIDGQTCYHQAQLRPGERQILSPVACAIPATQSPFMLFGQSMNTLAKAIYQGEYGSRYFSAETPANWQTTTLFTEPVIFQDHAYQRLLGLWDWEPLLEQPK